MSDETQFFQDPGETKGVLFGPADQVAVLLTNLPTGLVLSVYVDKDGEEPEGFNLTVLNDVVTMDVFGGEMIDLDNLVGSIIKDGS